ncbi:MAG: DUF4091 domain-containing protein [Clostridia bacterium]|nr:DUF4091 domain-containing protein [Clostridia bacterium]
MQKPIVVSVNEWIYPDVTEYQSAKDVISLHTPKNSFASVQIFIPETKAGEKITVITKNLPFEPELYRMVDVFVKFNTGVNNTNKLTDGEYLDETPPFVTRRAPFRIYDCLMPFAEGGDVTEKENTALYLAFKIPSDAADNVYKGSVTVKIGEEEAEIETEITVHKAKVPEKIRLQRAEWFHYKLSRPIYDIDMYSEEWYELYRKYVRQLKRVRATHLFFHLYHIKIEEVGDKYLFDFSRIKRMMQIADEEGIPTFEMGHLLMRDERGDQKQFVENDYGLFYKVEEHIFADSKEGYNFLAQFLPALGEFLKENGWYDRVVQHVGDEPIEKIRNTFRIVCGIVRKFLPGIKLMDAVLNEKLRGSTDVWVPLNTDYEKNKETFEHFKELGDEVWHYTCCGPEGKPLNRLLDMELLRTRLLFYGNYRYNLAGYLHWGFASYQPEESNVIEYCNPIILTEVILPPGDSHIIYPGNANGPWPGARSEMTRMGAEDCELLWMLEKENKAKADEICAKVMRRFDDYETDVNLFDANRAELLKALDEVNE